MWSAGVGKQYVGANGAASRTVQLRWTQPQKMGRTFARKGTVGWSGRVSMEWFRSCSSLKYLKGNYGPDNKQDYVRNVTASQEVDGLKKRNRNKCEGKKRIRVQRLPQDGGCLDRQ